MNPSAGTQDQARILVIDDDRMNIKMFSDIFDDRYEVLFATDGKEGLAIASRAIPDLILLDVNMPEMDGREVCRRLKADRSTCDIPVIFVSGANSPDEELQGLQLGAADYLAKPVTSAIILARVANQIRIRQTQRQLEECASTLKTARASTQALQPCSYGSPLCDGKITCANSPVRLLIVDDELADLKLMTEIFAEGNEVLFAMDGPKALQLAETMHPELILLDVMMADMDGFEVCRRLKANPQTQDIPVIFITANLSPEKEVEGLEIGAVDYITKPINPRVVKARVCTHLCLTRALHQISAFNDSLEKQVEERTSELKTAMESLHQLREELVSSEARATITTLIASTSHELATPLGNSVLASGMLKDSTGKLLDLLDTGKLKRSELEKFLGELRDATDLLQRNLNRARDLLLNFKQVAVDQASEQRRKFDFADTVTEILATMAPSLKTKPHKVVLELPEGIFMDSLPGPLGQIIINLINNAYLHAFEDRTDGVLTITAEKQGDEVLIHVVDNGVGIPEDNLKRLFDPFFSTKIGKGGTGLGMAIVQSLVEKNLGGSVSVQSTVGVGTRFDFRLPLVSPTHSA
jgi:PleD family two-component response regulator/two-component sensor histidine kinase